MHSTGTITADTMCRTVELGVCITGAANAGDFTIIHADAGAVSSACPECGHGGKLRDHVTRERVVLPVKGVSHLGGCLIGC
ncbi:hypothetical protein [Corynebacterium auriscanis]|uniref:hypothetical protein n=1 Tax=Corynebacterium auriscanis TaxID=99807 RepID=UPI003CEBA86F